MNIADSITLNNSMRWKLAFSLFSMERCAPFFTEMGLPIEVVADPLRVALRARDYLKGSQATTPVQSANPDIYLTEMKLHLEDTFNQLAKDYNERTAIALHVWCILYIVEDNVTTYLSAWRLLFHQLCKTSSNEESFSTAELDATFFSRICNIVQKYLLTEYMHLIRERIKNAKSLPRSAWEEWLENNLLLSAGQGAVLGAVDLIFDLVESIIANYRTFQTWEVLNSQISAPERDLLVAWASKEADSLGIPNYAIHLSTL